MTRVIPMDDKKKYIITYHINVIRKTLWFYSIFLVFLHDFALYPDAIILYHDSLFIQVHHEAYDILLQKVKCVCLLRTIG